MFHDIWNVLFRPNTFFADKKNCGWKEPISYFILFAILGQILSLAHGARLGMFLPNPTLQYIFYYVFLNRAITYILVLGVFIILLLCIFRLKQDYLNVLKVLLFTQASWFLATLIVVFPAAIMPIFLNFDSFYMYHLVVFSLCHIIGLVWVLHTIITGITIFSNIPYKKGIIPVGISFILFLYIRDSGFLSPLYSFLLYYVYPNYMNDLYYFVNLFSIYFVNIV